MSHVATVELEIRDLEALRKACLRLGLEFCENQKTFKWYGRWMNDYSAAEAAYHHGVKPEDYGKCLHAIRIPGNKNAYEVGVIRDPKNPAAFKLIYDNFTGGMGLEAKIGRGCVTLSASYATEVARKQALRQGFRVTETTKADGTIVLKARR